MQIDFAFGRHGDADRREVTAGPRSDGGSEATCPGFVGTVTGRLSARKEHERRQALVQDDAMFRRWGYRDRPPPPRPTRQGMPASAGTVKTPPAATGGLRRS